MQAIDELVLEHLALPDPVFRHFASRPSFRAHLRLNQFIPEDVWIGLYDKKLTADEAWRMIDRPLTDEQIDHVIATEKRSSTLEALVTNHLAARTPERLEKIAEKCASSDLAAMLISAGVDPKAWPKVQASLRGVDKLTFVCFSPASLVSDDELVEALRTIDSWWGKNRSYHERKTALTYVIHTRPHLIPRLAARPVPEALSSALAASRLLVDADQQLAVLGLDSAPPYTGVDAVNRYVALSLVNNPVVYPSVLEAVKDHPDWEVRSAVKRVQTSGNMRISVPFEQVSDPMQLSRLLRRAMPNQYNPVGRPFDLVALAHNPNITGESASRVRHILCDRNTDYIVGKDAVVSACAAIDARLGVSGEVPSLFEGVYHSLQDRGLHTPRELDTPSRSVPDSALERVKTSPTRDLVLYKNAAAVLLHEVLGESPAAYEAFLNLAKNHHGELLEAATAAARLSK